MTEQVKFRDLSTVTKIFVIIYYPFYFCKDFVKTILGKQ